MGILNELGMLGNNKVALEHYQISSETIWLLTLSEDASLRTSCQEMSSSLGGAVAKASKIL